MADNNQGRLQPSQILNHPLGGRIGLLREIGASKDGSAASDAWARSLGRRLLWPFQSEIQFPIFSSISTFIYDEASRGIIGAVRVSGQMAELSMM